MLKNIVFAYLKSMERPPGTREAYRPAPWLLGDDQQDAALSLNALPLPPRQNRSEEYLEKVRNKSKKRRVSTF